VHLYCGFLCGTPQVVPQQTTIFQTASFRQFPSILRKDSVANYGSVWMQFPLSVRGVAVLYIALKVS